MFSMNAEEIYAKKYLQLGAKGYLSKASSEVEIKIALDNVRSGKRYISPKLNQAFTEDALGNKPKPAAHWLTWVTLFLPMVLLFFVARAHVIINQHSFPDCST